MLFLARSVDGFGLYGVLTPVIRVCKSHEIYDSFYIYFAFQTAICGPLERTELFIWPISYLVLVTCTIYLCVWVYWKGVHPFSVLTICNHFPICLEKKSKEHWDAISRVLRYLKGTKNHGLDY